MPMTPEQQRRYDQKRQEMLEIIRARGGSDSAFDEELPESVQAALRKRRTPDNADSSPERTASGMQDDKPAI